MTYILLLCLQWKTPDDGQRNCPKHVQFYSKNKIEKLVHLVDFIIRIHKKKFVSPPKRNIFLNRSVGKCKLTPLPVSLHKRRRRREGGGGRRWWIHRSGRGKGDDSVPSLAPKVMILGIPPQWLGLQVTAVRASKCMAQQDCRFPYRHPVLYVALTKT